VTNFTGVADAQALRKAMKGIGTDEKALVAVLGNRTYEQLQVIKQAFTREFSRDLWRDVKSETSGKFASTAKKVLMERGQLDAKIVREAIQGLGTDEMPVIELICTRNRHDLDELAKAYQTHYRTTIDKDIRGDFSGDLKAVLMNVLRGNRDDHGQVPDQSAVQKAADDLYRAGEAKWGTNEGVFIQTLTSRPPSFVEAVNLAYATKYGHDLRWVIKKEFSGYLKEALLALCQSPAEYLAERLHTSMIGAGTNDNCLIRIVVTRRGRDLSMIKTAFLKKYHKTLEQMIKDDTSGDYRNLLCSLVRSEPGA